MTMKTVAIVGAGPGGLVAAKTLLQTGLFQVTIFDKKDRLGGIWSVTKTQQEHAIIPVNMPTNLSRFAVTFSDLDWSSVEMPGKEPVHMHPKAWQVNQYLEEYARRYIPRAAFRLGAWVISIRKGENGGWNIRNTWSPTPEHFDYCILASGFYSSPQELKCRLDGFEIPPMKMIHSSQYRSLDDVLLDGPPIGKKLLVIGGGNSGGEAAAAVAFDLSNRQYSPGGDEHGYEIVHVLPQPVYGLPLFVPSADMPGSFVPLDIRLYDFDKRKDAPLTLKTARYVDDSKEFLHSFLQGMLGSDKYERGSHVLLSKTNDQEKLRNPKAAIQDDWASYVRAGAIKFQEGRVTALHDHGFNVPISATIQSTTNPGETTTIDDIAGVVYATGYTPEGALSILDPSVLSALSYDRTYSRLPILLPEDSLASSPFVPDLGIIGCYEGPYWGVMEMQARRLAKRWTSQSSTQSPEKPQLSDLTKKRLEAMLDIREALKNAPDLVPQYIFSDYMAIMEEAARDLGLERYKPTFGSGSITPAYYLDAKDNHAEAEKTRSEFQKTILAAHNQGRFVPHAIFRGLLGRWRLLRTLRSSHPDLPSGTVKGEMWFHPRTPGQVSDPDSPADKEYLCLESGDWTTENGTTMSVHKGTAWRFTEEPERLSVWFLKPEGRSLDYLYHDLKLVVPEDPADRLRDGKVVWKARADHWCDPDTYVTEYTFVFDGVALEEFSVVHTVTGPRKDYISTTRCTRPTIQNDEK